jgi:Uma2 family endonuclease
MSELIELNDNVRDDRAFPVGSVNHSRIQGKLIVLLAQDERLEVMPELSIDLKGLDISQFGFKSTVELKPDISVYWQTPVPEAEPLDDIIRSPSPPDLAIEIISASQTLTEMMNKMKTYFALGVKSCWLVLPSLSTIYVFSPPHHYRVFPPDSELVDEIMDIHLPIHKVFKRRSKTV